MSHTVTVTRTTTTTSTSAIILNTGYCKTVPGLLKIAEIIVGAIIFSLLFIVVTYNYSYDKEIGPTISFFKHVVVTFLIGSLLLFLGCLISISTGSIIAKTSYEFIYHGGAFILYTIGTIWLMVVLNDGNRYPWDYYKYYHISYLLGVVNCVLYCISCVFAYRSYRWP